MFQMDVAKVDRDVAYIAMVVHVCCNGCTRMLQRSVTNLSSVFSGRMLQVCLSGCCICFRHTLHVFYLDVCVWLQWFLSVLKCFRSTF